MAAIWLSVILGIITVVSGGLAGHLAAEKPWQKWAFWGAAIVSVFLFIGQGFLIERDTQQAEERGRNEQVQLTRIEKNTSQPPNVIVNPPAQVPPETKKTARVILSRFESAIRETVKNAETGRGIAFVVGLPVQMNLYFENRGDANAEENFSFGRIYLVPEESDHVEKELTRRFEREAAYTRKQLAPLHTPLRPAPDYVWITAKSANPITDDDIKKLQDGTERLYLFVLDTYKDFAGKHYMHHCAALQSPAFNPEVWHHCDDFEEDK